MMNEKWIICYDEELDSPWDILENITLKNTVNSFPKTIDKALYKTVESLSNKQNRKILECLKEVTDLKHVTLAYPVLLNDKRWDTIHLTSSSIFLGSALRGKGFKVTTGKQILPLGTEQEMVCKGLNDTDVLGFTLFEDLMLPFKEYLEELERKKLLPKLVAAGGPMVTLNMLETAYHLPQINLLVRGEAEHTFPNLLETISNGDIDGLMKFSGFLLNLPGLMILSDLKTKNQPETLGDFGFNLDFLQKEHLVEGLEVNVSRGCQRGCIFCSAVQGKKLRQIPLDSFDTLLKEFEIQLKHHGVNSPHDHTININDDDILQDPEYAWEIFNIVENNHYKLWGIQTSINSFFDKNMQIRDDVMRLVADRELYMGDNPLVWLGTDAFLVKRGKKLSKKIPGKDIIKDLVNTFEAKKIRNYHYWISSDHFSQWPEFIEEFLFIYELQEQFGTFGLIAHAPFLVPYSSTPLFRLLSRSQELTERIKYKRILTSKVGKLNFPLVERVETEYGYLNRLLRNEKPGNSKGFFDYLGQKDYLNAAMVAYHFLKHERMDAENLSNFKLVEELRRIESELEAFIGRRI